MRGPRALFVSNLFPSSTETGRGRYNLDQLRALREAGLEARVVSPRPWFPGWRTRATAAAPRPPREEEIEGFRVAHPRAVYLPGWKGALNGRLYGLSVASACRSAARTFAPDLVWASFGFPDAVGAAAVARRLRLPIVVAVHGSDVNVSFAMSARRGCMLRSFQQAVRVFSKSERMREVLLAAGVAPGRVVTIYNGVDREAFAPRPHEDACRELGLDASAARVAFFGNLVPVKGVEDLIEATRLLLASGRPVELVLAGDGPSERALREQAARAGIAPSVRFLPRQPRPHVARWMCASRLVALASRDEGVPNVVLEALASGRPVVATDVGGVAEVHPGPAAGALVPPWRPDLLAAALEATLRRHWDACELAALARPYDWGANARQALAELRSAGVIARP